MIAKQKMRVASRQLLAGCVLLALTGTTGHAQQTTGVRGSPDANATSDGRYIPPPPQQFEGEINLNAAQSKPPWGAPNVLVIMTDNQGYGVSGSLRGFNPAPSLDRIANAGLRYTMFHSTSPCSPS